MNNIKNDSIKINIKGNGLIEQLYKNILLLDKNNIKAIHEYYSTKNMDYYYKEQLFRLDIIYENNMLKSHQDDYVIKSNLTKNSFQKFEIPTYQGNPIYVGGNKNIINSYVYHKLYQYINGMLK